MVASTQPTGLSDRRSLSSTGEFTTISTAFVPLFPAFQKPAVPYVTSLDGDPSGGSIGLRICRSQLWLMSF